MQQPKPFYQQHDAYGPRPLDQSESQSNRPLQTFVLPDNPASVGRSNLYHPPSQEKDIFTGPPAGFQMAPCGCFFDPRIYRIEWAMTNFVQPSVYKLTGGSSSPNAYLLDPHRYLKSPVQTVPYPPYHPIPSNPQYIMPYFNQEGPANGTEQGNLVPDPLHDSQFLEMPQPQEDGQNNDNKLPQLLVSLPGLSQNEQSLQISTYCQLKGRPSPHNPEFQGFDSFQVDGEELKENHMSQNLLVNTQIPDICIDDQNPLSSPSVANAQVMAEAASCPLRDSLVAEDSEGLDTEEPFDLPEKVLLEDAMKLFDCSPANSDSEVSRENLSRTLTSSESESKDGCFPCDDSSSDIRSLNLPDELLSFDYSVPEILNTVASMDYFYDLKTFTEDPKWDLERVLQPPQDSGPLQDPRQEPQGKEKHSSASIKKGKPTNSKNPPASAQESSTSDRQECPVTGV
ncbi:proline-rich protein 22 [Terrapene carolina triunguis]|uniref:proline-rich protein 22 n=1 Tax=Terrapene triunguis TaxID=2587831 RepID=UPI000CEF609A|nr:proline-rich protein 22 [Terrapene carolina triunguis]